MARPKKDAPIDLSQTHEFSTGLIERLTCPPGKEQIFLRVSGVEGLRIRCTANGAKSWVYEAKIERKTFRRTIGPVSVIGHKQAEERARSLGVTVKNLKQDPRELEREEAAKKAAQAAAAAAQAVTVGELWPLYLATGKPKRRDAWKPRYKADLEAMASAGGEPKKRGKGLTRPGPLFPLLALPLSGVTEEALKIWFDSEAQAGKHQAARALMMFRGFLRWCAMHPTYRRLIDKEAGKAPSIVNSLPSMKRRTDALEAAQVPGWWAGVEQLSNRTASVYLRALLLTGARREEMAALTWANVDFQWRKMTIADKVEDTRTIPMTPYLAQMLATLPRVNEFVFASTSKTGRIADTRASHATALLSAGIKGLTIHGLRRTFSLLGEASGAPAGAIAQVMGHKPSATAEGYRPRSMDALRPYLEQIEAYILGLAGVSFDPKAEPGKLRAVA